MNGKSVGVGSGDIFRSVTNGLCVGSRAVIGNIELIIRSVIDKLGGVRSLALAKERPGLIRSEGCEHTDGKIIGLSFKRGISNFP